MRKLIAFLTEPEPIRRILQHLPLSIRPPPIREPAEALFEFA